MKKFLIFVLTIGLVLALTACGTTSESDLDENTNENPQADPVVKYFESDANVNEFFSKYNEIATYAIGPELIEEGNIETKALVYADNFSLEIINVGDETVSIKIETTPEEENTVLFTIFNDCIKATASHSDDEIKSVWNALHQTGYLVEDYDFNGIIISYVPSKELSYGISNPRIDLTIPF